MIEHWSEFSQDYPADYDIGFDPACPDSDRSGVCVVASVGPGLNPFWYIAQGMEILWVDMPNLWPLDSFEWHENETWWLRYAKEHDIDITRYVPIGGR